MALNNDVDDFVYDNQDSVDDGLSAKVSALETNMVQVTEAVNNLTQIMSSFQSADTAERRKRRLSSASSNMDTREEDDLKSLMGPKDTPSVDDTSLADGGDPEDADILDRVVAEWCPEEATGPPVERKLAEIVNNRLSTPLSAELIKKKEEDFPRPINCDTLAVPKVNTEIWRAMNHAQRSRDIRFSNLQKAVVKATTGVTTLADKLRLGVMQEKISKCDDEKVGLGKTANELHRRCQLAGLCQQGTLFPKTGTDPSSPC